MNNRDSSWETDSLLFARGFLLSAPGDSTAISALPSFWRSYDLGTRWRLHFDPQNQVERSVSEDGSLEILILGYAIHSTNGKNGTELARHLLQAVESSNENFQSELDECAGRYLLVRRKDTELHIQQDAVGLRSVYYSAAWTHRALVASHDRIIARALGSASSPFGRPEYRKNNYLNASPGNMTLFNGVKRLTPNTELSTSAMQVKRVYPRFPAGTKNVEEAYHLLEKTVDTQLRWWNSHESGFENILMSLSGGFDSRSSLALIRPHLDDFTFFTYRREKLNKYNNHDARDTAELIEKFSLNHQYLDLDEVEITAETKRAIITNTHFSNSAKVAQAYLDFMPEKALHIRSNAYEIVRAHYRKNGFHATHLHARAMQSIAYSGRNKDPFAEIAFEQWRIEAEWPRVEELGYDPLDFFYWEYRMGAWLAPVLHESDMSSETAILINCRNLLDTMLSVPWQDRKMNSVFEQGICGRWPELAEVPINGYWLGESENGAYH